MNPYFFLKKKQSQIFISVPIHYFMIHTFISNPNQPFVSFLKKETYRWFVSDPNLRFFFKKRNSSDRSFQTRTFVSDPNFRFSFKKETFRSFVSDPNLRFRSEFSFLFFLKKETVPIVRFRPEPSFLF